MRKHPIPEVGKWTECQSKNWRNWRYGTSKVGLIFKGRWQYIYKTSFAHLQGIKYIKIYHRKHLLEYFRWRGLKKYFFSDFTLKTYQMRYLRNPPITKKKLPFLSVIIFLYEINFFQTDIIMTENSLFSLYNFNFL